MSAALLKLRLATPDEADTLYAMINNAYAVEDGNSGASFKCTPRLASVREVDNWIAKNALFVACNENENAILGGGVLTPLDDRAIVDLGPFFVDAALKGTGKGSAILKLLKRTARDQLGASTFEITVINHRTDLFPFYEKRGFVRTGLHASCVAFFYT
jgi:GNAT superfamily N-acetyltransferase